MSAPVATNTAGSETNVLSYFSVMVKKSARYLNKLPESMFCLCKHVFKEGSGWERQVETPRFHQIRKSRVGFGRLDAMSK